MSSAFHPTPPHPTPPHHPPTPPPPHLGSEIFFRDDRVTSPHPLVIGAGFDGTGLQALRRAFEMVGKGKVQFPGVDFSDARSSKAIPSTPLMQGLFAEGLQGPLVTPQQWEGVDLIQGEQSCACLQTVLGSRGEGQGGGGEWVGAARV